uniref:Caudal type homeobox 2 n=1 Tax=Dromaius novaehollandiae TaxID=8790 RepID=A0A8C4JFC7_DRONO
MYVSYLLDKDGPMYPSPVRHSGGLNLAAQNFVGAPQYADYGGYHVNLDSAQSPGPAWPAPYGAPLRDDWGAYGQGGARGGGAEAGRADAALPCDADAPAERPGSPFYFPLHPRRGDARRPGEASRKTRWPDPARPARCRGAEPPWGGERRGQAVRVRAGVADLPFFPAVKTRTKDKYRVVYTDHQRLELEKEFHYSRYITIRRKAELASTLGLSERQVCPSGAAPARPPGVAWGWQAQGSPLQWWQQPLPAPS